MRYYIISNDGWGSSIALTCIPNLFIDELISLLLFRNSIENTWDYPIYRISSSGCKADKNILICNDGFILMQTVPYY